MPTTRYTVHNGRIVSENRNGIERDYVPDPLGSTVALLDNTQAKTDTFQYWPYGEERSRTGTTPTPFRFVGSRGYYRDSARLTYVRARYLQSVRGNWLSADPLGFGGGDLNIYRHRGIDPSGLGIVSDFQCVDNTAIWCCQRVLIHKGTEWYKEFPDVTTEPGPQTTPRCQKCCASYGFATVGDWCNAIAQWEKKQTPLWPNDIICLLRNQWVPDRAQNLCKNVPDPNGTGWCQHCVASCILARNCGRRASTWAGWCKEMKDLTGCSGHQFDPRGDMGRNRDGLKCAEGKADCFTCCRQLGPH
jgi:RHS repeat-associated protein